MKKAFATFAEVLFIVASVGVAYVAVRSSLNPPDTTAETRLFPVSLAQIDQLSIPIQLGSKGHGTIVEALDYLCPPCHSRNLSFTQARREYPQLGWRTVIFPLAIHPGSFDYALAGLEARDEGCYENFQNAVMSKFPIPGERPRQFFEKIGPWALRCWLIRKKNLIEKERLLNEMKKLPIDGTPTLIAFNKLGAAVSTNSLKAAISFCKQQ